MLTKPIGSSHQRLLGPISNQSRKQFPMDESSINKKGDGKPSPRFQNLGYLSVSAGDTVEHHCQHEHQTTHDILD